MREWNLKAALETIKTGDGTIPPLEVHYHHRRTPPRPSRTLRKKPLPVQIKSVLENRLTPRKFRDIQGTVDVTAAGTAVFAA